MEFLALADDYLRETIAEYRVQPAPSAPPHRIRRRLMPFLQAWAGSQLEFVSITGAHAKDTAIKEDGVDLFVSLGPHSSSKPQEMHAGLAESMREFGPHLRNVALRIDFEGVPVDLVPARRQKGTHDHILWQLQHSTALQTNIDAQVRHVRLSGRHDEILALKIWDRRNTLGVPAFLLELAAIQALAKSEAGTLGERFVEVLQWLASDFKSARLLDPGNPANVMSDVIDAEHRVRVAERACDSLRGKAWPEVV